MVDEIVFGKAVCLFVKSKGYDVDVDNMNETDFAGAIEKEVVDTWFEYYSNVEDMIEFTGLYLALKKKNDGEEPIVSVGEMSWFLDRELNYPMSGKVDFDDMDINYRFKIEDYI